MQDGGGLQKGIAEQIQDTGGFPRSPMPGAQGAGTQALTPVDAYENLMGRLQKVSDSNKVSPGAAVPIMPEQIDISGRYPKQLVGADNEELYAEGQSAWNKFGNAFVKMLGTAGSTFAQGTIGLLDGAVEWANTGDFSKLYGNTLNQNLTNWTQGLENKFPNYYTHRELDSKWYSGDNLLTANFWFDKVMKNLGFSLGAAAGGFAWGAALRAIGLTSALARAGANMDALAADMETTLAKIPQAERGTASLSYLSNNAKQYAASTLGSVLSKSDRIVTAAMGTFGESSMESIQNSQQFRQQAIEEFKKTHGFEPTGADLDEINKQADYVGNWSFGLNSILLTGTNYIQFPRMLNMSYRGEKAAANSIETQSLRQAEGKFLSALPEKGFAKRIYQARNLAGLLFNPTEAFEEGAQNVIQEGTIDFFDKAKENKDTSFWQSLGVGVDRTLNTKNGIEQILIGGFSGALQTSGILPFNRIPVVNKVFGGESMVRERGFTGYGGERARATAEAITALNRTNFASVIKDNVDSFNRSQVIQEERDRALRQGDILETKEKEFDFAHNYLYPRIKYGKYDFVKSDIDYYKQAASVPEEFDRLQREGYALPTDTPESFIGRLNNLERHAETAKKYYENFTVKYGDRVNDKGERVYSPEVIDKMVYAASKIDNYDERIPALSDELLNNGVAVQDAIDNIYINGAPSEAATKDALAQINNLSTTEDNKDNLKRDLQDVLELSLRRRSFVKEFNKIQKNPESYKDTDLTPEEAAKETVQFKEGDIIVGQEYGLKNPIVREGNTLTPNPTITVLSQTLAGEFEVKLPNGQSRFLTKQQLENYQLSALPRKDDKVEAILNDAIDKTLASAKYKDLKVPEGQTPLQYVNSLDNKDLVDDILERANKQFNELVKRREKQEKELKDLQERKDLQAKLFTSLKGKAGINTGNLDDINIIGREEQQADESRKKALPVVFASTTSASEANEPDNVVPPRVVRERNFLFNHTFFSDKVRENLKALVFTANSEESLGLKGYTETVRRDDPDANLYNADDVEKAPVLVAYAVERGGFYHFVDENGKLIGQVGTSVDRNKIIVSTMPSTSTTWRDGKSRFRKEDQDQAAQMAAQWKEKRIQFFKNTTFTPFEFSVSRGLPIYDSYEEDGQTKYRENAPANTLFDKKKAKAVFLSQGTVVVANTDNIQHQGINYKTELGRIYFKYNDRFAPLTNRKFTESEQDTLFKILQQFAKEKGQPERLRNYLRNVLYFPETAGKNIGRNQIWIDADWNLNMGNAGVKVPFTPTGLQDNEAVVRAFLSGIYNNVNSETLEKRFNDPFEEILDINEKGEYVTREWKNYQQFLLDNEYNGEKRTAMLGTPVRSLSAQVANDRNFQQKYAVLQGLEYTAKKPEAPKEEPKPEQKLLTGAKEFNTSKGEKLFYTLDNEGNVNLVNTGDFAKAVERVAKLEASAKLAEQGITKEEAAQIIIEKSIQQTLTAKPSEPEAPKPQATAKTLTTPQDEEPEFRLATIFAVDRMSEDEKAEFNQFIKQKLPQFKVEEVYQILKTADNRNAWGQLQRDIITLYSGAEKGTGYHEVFEAVWKYFLTPAQEQAVINEVKARKGSFNDRLTQEEVFYPDATEKQLKEQLADEFADYKLGRKTSIGRAIREFFDRIVKFFRTFLRGYRENKPLVQELFEKIERGAFRKYELPDFLDNTQEFRAVAGLTEAQTNGYVQDITARAMFELLREGADLFDPAVYKRNDIFDTIKSKYQEVIASLPEGINTFNQLVAKTKEYLATYSIQFDEDNTVNINDEGVNRVDYDSSTQKMKLDVKKSQPFAIKLLLGTLYRTEEQKDSFGQPAKKKGIVGNYELIPPSKTTITLLEALSGSTSIDDMIGKLKKLSDEDSDYVRLINRLGKRNEGGSIDFDNLSPAQWRMIAGFYNSFNKQKPEVKGIVYREGEVYFRPMDIGSSQRQLFNSWENNIRLNARSGKSIFQPYDRKLKAFRVDKAKLKELSGRINTVGGQLAFLNDLGINVDEGIYNRLNGDQKDSIANAVNKIAKYLDDQGGLKIIEARAIDISGPLTTISEVYSKALKPDAESTFLNGEGEQQPMYVQPNYVSKLADIFNSVATLDELKEQLPFLNDEYSTSSEVLKLEGMFFNEDGNRNSVPLRIGYLNASERRNRNKLLKDSDYTERLETQVNSILDGIFYISVPADGATDWTINLPEFITYSELLSGSNKINNKMINYLVDEIKLASEDRKNITNVGNKSKELRFFKDILSPRNVERINRVIANELSIDDLDRDSLIADFEEYIQGEVAKLRNTLMENESLYQFTDGTYEWNNLLDKYIDKCSLPKNKRLTGEQLNNILNQTIINDFVANTELHKFLFGDPYNFKVKEDALDETKRIKSFLSPAQPSLVSDSYNNKFTKEWANTNTITDYIARNNITSSTITDVIMSNPLPGYNKVNEADSQAYHTILMHRDLLNRHFKWGKDGQDWLEWELAYTRVRLAEKGVKIGEYSAEQQAEDQKAIAKPKPEYKLNVIKPIVRGVKHNEQFNNAILDKFSSAPIWYSAVEGTNLENLFVKMLKEGVDYVIMESGRKVGAEGTHNLYNSDGTFNTLPFNNKINIGWENYAVQVENQYDESGLNTRGTQITKLFSLDFFEEGKPNDYKGTEDWNALSPEEKEKQSEMERRKNENNRILNELTIVGYEDLLNRLGIIDQGDHFEIEEKGRDKLMDSLLREAQKRDMSDNIRDIFKNPSLIPFEATSEYTKIQKMLYSMADRSILSPSHNGGQKTQMSVLGWESKGKPRLLTSSALKFYTKDEPWMEILLPNWFRKRLDPKDRRTDEELLKYLNSSKDGKSILDGIGFRIPTQAMNQIEAFKIKGFLAAEYGDTVVVPSEITTKAGSDFDIDKLNTYLKNIYVDSNGDIKLVPFFGFGEEGKKGLKEWLNTDVANDFLLNIAKGDETALDKVDFEKEEEIARNKFSKLYRQSLENAYIDNLRWFVTHPSNFEKLVQPTEGGPLKAIANEIDELTGQKEDVKLSNLLSVNYLSKLRQQFMSAKKWIGIVVNGITSHAQAQRTQLYIDVANTELSGTDKEMLGDGIIRLPHNTVEINGRKLPTMSKLLDRAGKYISDKLSWYTTAMVDVAKDPYITKIIHNKKLVPVFTFLERVGVPTRDVALFMNQPIIREYLKYSDKIGFSRLANPYWRDEFLSLGMFPNSKGEAEIEVEEFPDCIKSFYKSDKPFGERLTDQQNRYQNLVLNEFLKYFKMSENLFKFTMATNWDTADLKTGGSIFKKQLRTVRENKYNIFKTPARILNSTGLGTIASTMVNVREAVGTLSRLESPAVRTELDEILKTYASLEGYQDQKTFEKIDAQITNSFIDYLIQTKSGLNNNIHDTLIDESKSTAAVIQSIQKNPDVLAAYNNNPIFANLRTQVSNFENGGDNIILRPFPKSAYDKNLITGYLREIKELDKELYGKIVRLALLQGTGKLNNLLSYIPSEDFAQALSPYIAGNLKEDAAAYRANYSFERSNWKDDDVVPEVELKMYTDYHTGAPITHRNFPYKAPRTLKLSETYNSNVVSYPVVKVRRSIPIVGTPNRWDIIDKKTLIKKDINEKAAKRDFSFVDYVGYQKILKANGEPLTATEKDSSGKPMTIYFYKQINLLGTGDLMEHYPDGRPSQLDNQTVKIQEPPADDNIVETVEKPKPIVPKPQEKVVPLEEKPPMATEILPLSEPMNYGMKSALNIFGRDTSTIDEIIAGNRTSTTRGYWHNIVKGKVKSINDFVGKTVNFNSSEGKSIKVKIISVHKITKEDRENPEFLEQWSKSEGWTKEHLLKATKIGEYQVKFEKISTPDITPEEGTEGVC